MRLIPIEKTGHTLQADPATRELVRRVVEMTRALYSRRGYSTPWIGYLAAVDNEIVGSCGFAGPPSNGEAEIAYFTFPGNEGRGVATRMARELLRICRPAAAEGGIRFIAHTLPEEGPSTSILRKLGFRLEGPIPHPEDGTVWKWSEPGASEAEPFEPGNSCQPPRQ